MARLPKKLPEKVEVLKDSFESMADNIAKIADVGDSVKRSPLRERVIWLLIRDMTGMSIVDIRKVLDALPELRKRYLK